MNRMGYSIEQFEFVCQVDVRTSKSDADVSTSNHKKMFKLKNFYSL